MRTKLNKLAAAFLLGLLAVAPVRAQTNEPVEADTAKVGVETATQSLVEVQKQKQAFDKEIESDRIHAQAETESRRYEAQRMIIHDLSWGSWVIFAIAGFYYANLKDKRRHETIRQMIEKGTPITPELLDGLKRNRTRFTIRTAYDPHGYLCWGVTLIAVGAGIIILAGRPGFIVLAIGLANWILWRIDRKHSSPNDSQPK